MAVTEFHADMLLDDEKDFICNPEMWFQQIGKKDKPFMECLKKRYMLATREGRNRSIGIRRSKLTQSKSNGYRLPKLASSLLRPDKKKPPLCIFCLDDDPDISKTCGRLQWCPEFPLFFAVHELCILMVPELITHDNPTPLGRQLFNMDVKQINRSFLRGRKLTCTLCRERGALVGCCSASCRVVLHLPCAVRSKCYIDYEDFRCFCPRHSQAAFNARMKKLSFSKHHQIYGKKNYDCCICMDPVGKEIALHSVIRTDCCGPNFYHFDCMKNATLIRGQEMRCPKCNQPNDHTDFEEKIRRQGIFIQMYNVVDECNDDDSMDGNQLSPCYYSMTRNSAKGRSCLSSLGPYTYDETDALDDRVFNPHEALNACISCGIHCHRICAGPPWSCYNPDGEGEEEKWQCEDCRDVFSPVTVVSVPVSCRESNAVRLANENGKSKKKRSRRLSIPMKRQALRKRN